MKLSEFKQHLNALGQVSFIQANGDPVPPHFHITEVGLLNKHFIDCGNTIRTEKHASIQLWEANDLDHRLLPGKLLKILDASSSILGEEDLEIEIEYQTDTIGKYGLSMINGQFTLVTKHTACLASDHCGTGTKSKLSLSSLGEKAVCCEPGSGCC